MTKIEKEILEKNIKIRNEGYDIYKKLHHLMGWEEDILYIEESFKKVELVYTEKLAELSLSVKKVGSAGISSLLESKEDYHKLLKYCMTNKYLRADPHLCLEGYLCHAVPGNEKGYTWKDELKNMTLEEIKEWASELNLNINYKTGEFNCNIPLAKPMYENNDYIEKLLSIIFPDNGEKDLFKRFSALYTFEDRYGLSKPTLVLFGKDRGTGKNLTIEYFLGSIYPGQIDPVATNSGTFTAGLLKKGMFYDERTDTGGKNDSYKFYDMLKRFSGSSKSMINIKQKEAYGVLSGTYVMIASQEKPFHLRDMIEDSENNQFIVFKTVGVKKSQLASLQREITALGMGFTSIADFLKKNIGNYVWDVLFPLYEKMKLEAKDKSYRYGMNIPITKGLMDIQNKSITVHDRASSNLLEDLYNNDNDHYKFEYIEKQYFEHFSMPTGKADKGFLCNEIKSKILEKWKIKEQFFLHFLEKYDLLKKLNYHGTIKIYRTSESDFVENKRKRGLLLDWDKLHNIINNDSWFPDDVL